MSLVLVNAEQKKRIVSDVNRMMHFVKQNRLLIPLGDLYSFSLFSVQI